jgi:antirestriction protein ArdC
MEVQTQEKKVVPKDVHQIINERIIEYLNKDIAPWRVPWTEAGVPTNLISAKPYRGINVMLLAALSYQRNVFITANQLIELGASVKPKEKPHLITYWNNAKKEGEGMEAENAGGKKGAKLQYYLVYNIAQCAGILTDLTPELVQETDPAAACARIVDNMPNRPAIKHKESKAYYEPLEDFINLAKPKSFPNDAAYHSALFHQLIHSTGHHTRLDRMGLVQMPEFGCDPYSLEELVAEIGACYLRCVAGIASEFDERTVVNGWIGKLKLDRQLIFTACSLAQKAVDYILNIQPVEEPVLSDLTETITAETT